MSFPCACAFSFQSFNFVEFFIKCDFHAFFCAAHIFVMKSKLVINKVERLESKHTGAGKRHAVLNFLSSVIFMLFCSVQKRMILQNNFIFVLQS